MRLVLFVLMFSTSLHAEENQVSPRIYRGEGEHQCQAERSIGHICKTLGVNYMDCNHAFYELKAQDCCRGSQYGGVSIAFRITKCTNFSREM